MNKINRLQLNKRFCKIKSMFLPPSIIRIKSPIALVPAHTPNVIPPDINKMKLHMSCIWMLEQRSFNLSFKFQFCNYHNITVFRNT